MISLSSLIEIFILLGGIIGVWVRNEVAVARLRERVAANEKKQDADSSFTSKALDKLEKSINAQLSALFTELKSINRQLGEIELELANKVDRG